MYNIDGLLRRLLYVNYNVTVQSYPISSLRHFTSQMELALAKVFLSPKNIQWVHERHGSLERVYHY